MPIHLMSVWLMHHAVAKACLDVAKKLQASGTIEGITFSAYLENDIVYLKVNGIKVQVSIDELMGYLSELNIELPKIEIAGILEIVKEFIFENN